MGDARRIAQAGVIAAVYAVLTYLVLQTPIGNGIIQLRLSEALTVLACLTPAAIPGLTIGSLIANLDSVAKMGAVGLFDVVFGSLGTLLGAMWSWRFRDRTWLALLGPVVCNALIVPAYLPFMLRAAGLAEVPLFGVSLTTAWPLLYLYGVLTVGVGQAIVVYALGLPLLVALRRVRLPGLTQP
ncbi:MAG: QueT transporter family protein [Coriobacteriia bacterium]|nr:QueT transporter family protein [Coriobacteriia bacterium]